MDLVVVGEVPHVRDASRAFLDEYPSVPVVLCPVDRCGATRGASEQTQTKLSKSKEGRWEGNSEVSAGDLGPHLHTQIHKYNFLRMKVTNSH
jgi:hypothetical protein